MGNRTLRFADATVKAAWGLMALAGIGTFLTLTQELRAVRRTSQDPLAIGARLTRADGTDDQLRGALLVFIAARCHACSAQATFFSELAARRSCGSVFFQSTEDEQTIRAFATNHRIEERLFLSGVSPAATRVPTVVAIDSHGAVAKKWLGRFDGTERAELMAWGCR